MTRTLFVLAMSLCLSACAHLAAYERGALMTPVMVGSATSLETGMEAHVWAVRESMVGGSGGGASCGCN